MVNTRIYWSKLPQTLRLTRKLYNMITTEMLRIVARRHEEVGEDSQLVLRQPLLVLRPVVLVGSLEVLKKGE